MQEDIGPPSSFGISEAAWEQTSPEVRAAFQTTVLALQTVVLQLEARIRELELRLKTNSSNSSKPPSTDPPWAKLPNKKAPSGKPQGAQSGHPGKARPMLPPEDVDAIVECVPPSCTSCGADFQDDVRVGSPRRHQVHELPQIKATVTEYQLHRRRCAGCSHLTEAALPEEVSASAFGPRFQVALAFLTGRFRMSRREAQSYAEQMWGVQLSLGAIAQIERGVAESLKAPYEEAWNTVRAAAVRNVDETGWKEKNRRAWLWVAASSKATAFKIAPTRGSVVLKDCFGDALETGYFGSDRYSGYSVIPAEKRAVCHAHPRRDFKQIEERGGYAGYVVGRSARAAQGEMFAHFHEWKAGTIDHAMFLERFEPVKARLIRALEAGTKASDLKVQGMCRAVLKHGPALWTFASVPGVDPTNNVAERALRKGVLWRKGSFGSQSASGSRYAERMLTIAETCRQNGRELLEYLTSAVLAFRRGVSAPQLLSG